MATRGLIGALVAIGFMIVGLLSMRGSVHSKGKGFANGFYMTLAGAIVLAWNIF